MINYSCIKISYHITYSLFFLIPNNSFDIEGNSNLPFCFLTIHSEVNNVYPVLCKSVLIRSLDITRRLDTYPRLSISSKEKKDLVMESQMENGANHKL